MSGELEAAGAAATAGLAAAVIEGRKGKGGARHGEGKCLNCGADLTGAYCSACGQPGHVHRTLGHVFEEFLHGVVHFDTKAWRTAPMLIGRPGTLTRKYIHGQRARFISPLAMFLFTVFLMFFAFAFVEPGQSPPFSDMSRGELNGMLEDLDETEAELAEEFEKGAPNVETGESKAVVVVPEEVRQKLARRRLAVRAEIARRDGKTPPAGAETLTPVERDGRTNVADGVRDSLSIASRPQAQLTDAPGFEGVNAKFREKLKNPELLFYKVWQNAYKFSFLLVPISLPFVALLFLWKRGLTLYDHVVFTLYSLSFVSVLFIVMTLAGALGWTRWASGWFVWAIPAHMFFQLKGAYALGWFSALWRTMFLLLFAFISLLIFFITISLIGALG